MYDLLHSKLVKLDLINSKDPLFDCLTRASREAPWRPNSILNKPGFYVQRTPFTSSDGRFAAGLNWCCGFASGCQYYCCMVAASL